MGARVGTPGGRAWEARPGEGRRALILQACEGAPPRESSASASYIPASLRMSERPLPRCIGR